MDGYTNPGYFDYAASAPPWPDSIEAFVKTSDKFYANPSSNHTLGKEAKEKLLDLKKKFCDLLHFFDGRLLLCSSGSEANNTIIDGHLQKFPQGKLLIAEDVHDSIWYATEKHPDNVEVLRIDSSAQLPLEQFEQVLSNNISLVCISHACNETGAIHRVKEIADMCYRKNIRLLIDGAQTVGHLPLDLNDIPFSYYTFSGHKFGSVRSVAGALIRDDEFEPLIRGGKQEWNLRAGTENIAGLASLVVALRNSIEVLEAEMERLRMLKERILKKLKGLPHVGINTPQSSLPGLLSISVSGHSGWEMVGALAMSGYSVSTGSACHDNQMTPPRIISAMGRKNEMAIGTIRISMGVGTTVDSVNGLTEAILELIK